FWIRSHDSPVQELPPDTTSELYKIFRVEALEQRQKFIASGVCPYDMDVLYQFWSHFLIRNYNTKMYNEFYELANEDAQKSNPTGMENLIRFYYEALLSDSIVIRQSIARQYIETVKAEGHSDGRPAFTHLKMAWRDASLNVKNRKRIGDLLDPELRAALEQ
ncbi:hypothetical protein K402DRAFT_342799, partial [Aulographum hederae CBS 113979]